MRHISEHHFGHRLLSTLKRRALRVGCVCVRRVGSRERGSCSGVGCPIRNGFVHWAKTCSMIFQGSFNILYVLVHWSSEWLPLQYDFCTLRHQNRISWQRYIVPTIAVGPVYIHFPIRIFYFRGCPSSVLWGGPRLDIAPPSHRRVILAPQSVN